jgi:hypothetical protein
MAKEFWERFTIEDDGTLIDIGTNERFDFDIDEQTNELRLIPQNKRTQETKQKTKSIAKSLRVFSKPLYG